MPKGIAHGRIAAPEICQAKGWTVGTLIVSDAWSSPMEILEFRGKWVKVRAMSAGGRQRASGDSMLSFPPDVRQFEEKTLDGQA